MSRPRWHRALSALLALWLAVVLVEPAALHSCPVHAAAGRATSHGGHHAARAAGSAAAGAGAAHASRPAERHEQARTHVCTCLGHCAGGLVAHVPVGHLALAAPSRPTTTAPGRPQHAFVAAWVDFVLPFATAPPAAA